MSKKEPHPIVVATELVGNASAISRYLGVSRQTFMTMLAQARKEPGYKTPLRHAVKLAQLLGVRPHAVRPDVFLPNWTAKRVKINQDGSVK
jgi:DNA-binding transcriptional regulator YdaS (Cro superfamily)